jgi:D-alanine-D-alanine ligase
MRVAVLRGGRSSEHEVSLRSGEAVANGLEQAGHETVLVTIARDGAWDWEGGPVALAPGTGLLGADAVFPALHGPFGEDGCTQGLLEWLDVAYVGSDVLSSAICMDKLTLKRLCGTHALPQVEFVAAGEPGWRERCETMGLPLWVKPSRLGSSVGISKVESLDGLDAAVELALRHDPRVIVEAHAAGREIECSLLGNDQVEASALGEVVAHADWYDYETKYGNGGMELVAPAPLPNELATSLREFAVDAYRLAGCCGLARCDFFLEADGRVLLNEINTMPGFTETSVYGELWARDGVSYPDLCDRLVRIAVERFERERTYRF